MMTEVTKETLMIRRNNSMYIPLSAFNDDEDEEDVNTIIERLNKNFHKR